MFDSIIQKIQFWRQRRTRGFDESELWDLDYTILRFCAPRLRALAKLDLHGYPAEFAGTEDDWDKDISEEETNKRVEEWQAAINKMARAIELFIEHGGLFYSENEEGELKKDLELEAEFEEGWELFKKYFFALWD